MAALHWGMEAMSDIPNDDKPDFVAENLGQGSTSIPDRPIAPSDSPIVSPRFPGKPNRIRHILFKKADLRQAAPSTQDITTLAVLVQMS